MIAYEWRRALRDVPKTMFEAKPSKSTVLAVAGAIELYTDSHGRNAQPGSRRLADDVGCNVATVLAALRWLTANGWLECESNPPGGRAPVYALAMPDERASEVATQARDLWTNDPDGRASETRKARGSDAQINSLEINTSNSFRGGNEAVARSEDDGHGNRLLSDDEAAAWYARQRAALLAHSAPQVATVRRLRDEHRLATNLVRPPSEPEEIDPIDAATAGWRKPNDPGVTA